MSDWKSNVISSIVANAIYLSAFFVAFVIMQAPSGLVPVVQITPLYMNFQQTIGQKTKAGKVIWGIPTVIHLGIMFVPGIINLLQ